MRSLFHEFGLPRENVGLYGDVLTEHYPDFTGRITDIVLHNFSLSLIVEGDVFDSYTETWRKNGGIVWGFHPRGSIVNFVSATPQSIDGAEDEGDLLEEVLQHENFHSFVESFFPTPYDDRYDVERAIFANIPHVDDQYYLPAETLSRVRRHLKHNIRELINLEQEELLAEIASVKRPPFAPRGTFAVRVNEGRKFLEGLKGKSKSSDVMIDLFLNEWYFDLQKIRERIEALYSTVEKHCPHRLEDLDIAFALFPPTKLHQVEKLVQRWITV